MDDGTYAHNPSTGLPEKVNNTLDGVLDYCNADVVTVNDYYPFGMEMPGRKFSVESGYRYRFNGKEQDKETSSTTTYDYGFRVYNPALGRLLSVDPLTPSYPWNSTYCFTENDVIRSIDLDGMEKYIVVNYWKSGKLERTQIEAYRDNDTKQIINVQFIQKGVPLTEMDVLIYDIYDEGTKKEKIIWDEAEDLTKEQKAIFSKSFSIENIVAGEKEV